MSPPTADALTETLRPLRDAPDRAAVLCDVDGTLAPIVERAEDAVVNNRTASLLGMLGRRYALVACISGRGAQDARRLVGVGGITYVGAHGAELLEPGATTARLVPAYGEWRERVQAFTRAQDQRTLRLLRLRVEDKGAITAFHWRGARDEDAAVEQIRVIAAAAEEAGLATHWGRKVLEVRPPVSITKGDAVATLLEPDGLRHALFGGDDLTDLDVFDALDELEREGGLETAVRVGIRSDEGPAEIVDRADVVVDGVGGYTTVLEALT